MTVLSIRQLNRALLARQGLLERRPVPALEEVERLAGLQAQVPAHPYVALWSRLEGFAPAELSDALAERLVVRGGLLRGTVHLVSARDALWMEPLGREVLVKSFRTHFAAGLRGAPSGEVVAAGRELLEERPRTRAELSEALAARWPDADPAALGHAVVHHLAVVQTTPRGQWRASHRATWALLERWLGAPVDPVPSVDDLVLRYLAAFGPATTGDLRTWSRLTGLRAVVERLRPRLRRFRDERGRELLDVPDGPLPDPGVPAPPRLLPEFDNAVLSHEDRSRIGGLVGAGRGPVLVDGFVAGAWWHDDDAIRFDPPALEDDAGEEAARLLAFLSRP